MKRIYVLTVCALLAASAPASWYWPFGEDEPEADSAKRPRLSELMEPASVLIDEATDLAEDGKSTEAVIRAFAFCCGGLSQFFGSSEFLVENQSEAA